VKYHVLQLRGRFWECQPQQSNTEIQNYIYARKKRREVQFKFRS